MSAPLRSLLLGFGIQVEGREKLDEVDGRLQGIIDKVAAIGQAMAAAFLGKALVGFVTDQIEVGRTLGLTAEKLGITVDELERFRFAAGQTGVGTEVADRALMMFNRQLGEAEINSKTAAKGFGKVGDGFTAAQLSAMPLGEMLGHIATGMAGMTDKGQKTQVMMKLFNRQGAALIPMMDELAKDPKKFDALFDALGGGIGEDFAKQATEAGNGIKRLSFAWDVLKTRIVGAVLPAVEKIVGWFIKLVVQLQWLQKHSFMAQTALIALAAAAVVAFAPFLASVLPIVAAMTALYLIFDDLYTLFEGGNSLLGHFIDKLYGKGSQELFVTYVKTKFQEFIDWIKTTAIPAMESLGTVLSNAFTSALPGLRLVSNAFESIGRVMRDFANGHWGKIGKDIDAFGSGAPDFGDKNEELWNEIQTKVKNQKALDDFKNKVDATLANPAIPLPPGGANSSQVSAPVVSSVTTGPVSVVVNGGATNAETHVVVKQAVEEALSSQIQTATQSLPTTPETSSSTGGQ